MADKPWIVQKLQENQEFFAKWSRRLARLGLRKFAGHLEWAEMEAVDGLLPWQTCSQCGMWFRDDDRIVELCPICRHPGECPRCESDDVVVDWHFNCENTIRYFVECHHCDLVVPEAGAPTALKALSAWNNLAEEPVHASK